MGLLSALVRYTGLMALLSVFIASGIHKVTSPGIGAALLAKSNFQKILNLTGMGYTLRANEFQNLVLIAGVVFLSFSAFILLNVGRSFFAFLLAMGMALVTISFHVNIENPAKMTDTEIANVLTHISIIGGLLFVAGSGHGTHRYSAARATLVEKDPATQSAHAPSTERKRK